MKTFEKKSRINTTLEELMAFHQDSKALTILTPPPIFMQMRDDRRTSITEGDLEFTLWMLIVPIKWHVQHEALEPDQHGFADRMLSGPMAHWRHEHIFEPAPDGEEGVYLIDRVTLSHKPGIQGILTRLMFDGIPLRILFFYRHLRTRLALQR